MNLDIFVFFLTTFMSLLSFMGFGMFFNRYFLLEDNKNINNQFNFFFLGLVFILPFSFIYHLLVGSNEIINLAIIIFGFFYYIYEMKFKGLKLSFFLTLIFFSGLIISKTHEDFTSYHFQHIKELSDGSIKFGLANLDDRYFYSSIFSYVQSLYKLVYFDLRLIHIPIYLFYLSLIGYLWIEILNKKKSYLLVIIIFFIILKFKRLSEFGYDYIGQFVLIYLFIEYVLKSKINFIDNTKLILVYFSTLLIKVSNLYFIPIIIAYFLMQKFSKNLISYKKILLPTILILFTFSFNSFLKTGCLNYLIEMTCASPEKIEWVYNYKNIESTKDLTKNWSRGLYHQKGIKLSESDYNKNFKWVQNWFNSYFINKLGSFIFLIILISLIIRYTIFKDNFFHKINIILHSGIVLSLLIWFLNFPQLRFGFAGIIIFFIVLIKLINGDNEGLNKKRFILFIMVICIYFNISNILRINKEFKRNDIYKFVNFPWFAQPKLDYKLEKNNDFKFERSLKSQKFWRTCFNANLTCVNHDDKIKFNKKRRLIFISKF